MKRLILCILACFICSSSQAVTWVHAHNLTNKNSSSGATDTVSLGFTPASGSLLAVFCADWASNTALSVSDNSSGPADTWVQLFPQFSGFHGTSSAETAWATIVTAGTAPTSVSCNGANTSSIRLVIADNYTGGPSSVGIDGTVATEQTTTNTASIGFSTGAVAGDLAWSALSESAANTITMTSGNFTLRGTAGGGASADDIVAGGIAANTRQTATYSISASTGTGAFVVAFTATGQNIKRSTPVVWLEMSLLRRQWLRRFS